jgi:cytochrome c-type biogenesis protein CcmH
MSGRPTVGLRVLGVVLASVVMAMAVLPARAVLPDERLSDPALEARARALSKELRCLVCQNQSIDDSDAPLAKDLRLLVRERLKAGDTDSQAMGYLVARYGDFVRLRPALTSYTLVLWGAPFMLLLGGGVVVSLYLRRLRRYADAHGGMAAPLEEAEEAALRHALARLAAEGEALSIADQSRGRSTP